MNAWYLRREPLAPLGCEFAEPAEHHGEDEQGGNGQKDVFCACKPQNAAKGDTNVCIDSTGVRFYTGCNEPVRMLGGLPCPSWRRVPPSPIPRSQDPLHHGKAACAAWEGAGMPELSRFYGIVITMYSEAGGNHSLPHIHVRYGNMRAVYSLQGDLLRGKMPLKQHKLVLAWMALHEQESYEDRYLASSKCACYRIPPLK